MGYFRDSAEEVQACIDALLAAQGYADPELRRASANEAIGLVERLQVGRKLAPNVRKLVEADDLTRAILLLRAYQQNRGFRLGIIPVVLVPLIAIGYFTIFPRMGGHHEAALKSVDECPTALEALGDDLEMPLLGFPTGSTQSNSGMSYAGWSIAVRGNSARGELSYYAYQHGGPWDVYHAALSVGDDHYLVVPCWGKVPAADAAGELQSGYEGKGTVALTKGKAPVAKGDACSIRVLVERDYPSKIPFNCKIQVTCADKTLYGAEEHGGYAFCHARGGKPVSAFDSGGSDTTGDPILELDLDKRTLRMSDDAASGSYSFTIEGL